MQYSPLSEELRYFQIKYELTKELQEVAIQNGYTLFEPEFFESYDRFVKMNPRVKNQSLVKLLDNDGSVLVLRPDITTAVIKRVMPKWQTGHTLRLFYLSTIFSRSSQGDIEEQKQFGIEHLGTAERLADQETLSIVLAMFKRFQIPFLIELSNSRFLEAWMDPIPWSEEQRRTFKELLYVKNQDGILAFLAKTSVSSEQSSLLLKLLNLQGGLETIESALLPYSLNPTMIASIDALKNLMVSISKEDRDRYVRIDLTMLSQYDYYDGVMFKAYVPSVAGPVLSGGRYDPLTKAGGQTIPAIGFTLNTKELLKEVIRHRG
jgi:ATP phosphoribosyltransferase regulatory subunit